LLLALAASCNERFEFDVPDAAAAVACSAELACPLDELQCELASGRCVECVEDGDCERFGLARCDAALHRCVDCGLDSDCPAGERCEPLGHRCVLSCDEDVECGDPAFACDSGRGLCQECANDEECEQSPRGGRCLPGGSTCVECRSESDCPDRHCDVVSGRCVECRDTADCAPGLVCEPGPWHCEPPN
jgi:hypothetical protein